MILVGAHIVFNLETKTLSFVVIGCPPGTYGTDCSQDCSCEPENELAPCDPRNGTCYCQPGYTGQFCEEGNNLSINPVRYQIVEYYLAATGSELSLSSIFL